MPLRVPPLSKLDRLLPIRRSETSAPLPDTHPVMRRRLAFDERMARLAVLDQALIETAGERLDLVEEILELAEQLWPSMLRMRGRRPPSGDDLPLPEISGDARFLYGRHLRSVCLVLLRRLGPLALRDLHRLLHLHGFAIASRHPGKTLANALAFEVAAGRARRIERGVYDVDPRWQPRAGRHGAIDLTKAPIGLPDEAAPPYLLAPSAGPTRTGPNPVPAALPGDDRAER